MPLVKSVSVKISVDGADAAKLQIDKVAVKAEELKKLNPEITPQIDSAKALLQARILRAGLKAEFAKNLTETVDVNKSSLGSKLGSLLGSPGGGSGGLLGPLASNGLGPIPAALTSPAGLAAVAAGAGALAVEVTAVASGVAAATAGLGAFAVLAIPSFEKVKGALGDTRAQLAKLSPDERGAVLGIQSLKTAYDAMSKSFQPTVFKVFTDGLKIANNLLPSLKPLAAAAGTALDGLLKSVGKFTASSDFKKWVSQFSTLVGPAITAIGKGIGLVVPALGKLFTVFSGRDVAHAISIVFDTIFGAVMALRGVIIGIQVAWKAATVAFVAAAPVILGAVNIIIGSFKILADAALTAFLAPLKALSAVASFLHLPFAGALATAVTNIGHWKTAMDNAFGSAQAGVAKAAAAIRNAPLIAKLTANITGLQAKIAEAKTDLKDPKLTNPQKAVLNADISKLQAQVARAKAAIASLQGKTVPITVAFNVTGNGSQFVGGTGFRLAGGGPAYGGIHLVGEAGPELVYTPPGSYVYNHGQTEQMMSGTGGTGGTDRLVAEIRNLNGNVVALLTRQNSITAGVPDGIGATLNGAARSAAYRALYNSRG